MQALNKDSPPAKQFSPKSDRVESKSPKGNEAAQPNQEDPEDLVDRQINQMDDRIDERDPKLYVDVNIGKSGVERIIVYEGDTAESLAHEFCVKHNLKPEMRDKLVTLLEAQIAGVLPKIPEDEDHDDSVDQ